MRLHDRPASAPCFRCAVAAAGVVAVLFAAACSSPSPAPPDESEARSAPAPPGASSPGTGETPPGSSSAASADVARCISDINDYRTQSGLPALVESASIDAFSAAGSSADAQSGSPHGHFAATRGGNGVAFAENEIPGWSLKQLGGVGAVLDQGTKAMWNEGPGGGHHDVIANPSYHQVGCGITVTSDGMVWVTSDFR